MVRQPKWKKGDYEMKKRWISFLVSISVLFAATPCTALTAGSSYADIPAGSWAENTVYAARDYGLMQGAGDGTFGFGTTITKAEFITVLSRMFGWEPVSPDIPAFSDVARNAWYYTGIETALVHNVIDNTGTFRPGAPITREEMAVMLVRALGYNTLAQAAAAFENPFADVTSNKGYITIASDIGMTKGTAPDAFSPSMTAKREEAAAMLVRVYEKLISDTEWVHGFYAISSYSQKELTDDMDAVSAGWSRMSYSMDKGAYLNTTSSGNNEYSIPQGYENIVSYFKGNKTKTHLSVYMDTSVKVETEGGMTDICSAILLDPEQRARAVSSIVSELEADYREIGENPYSGVTIDFEGMKGEALKAGFNSFLTELSSVLKLKNRTLYVAVQPAAPDGFYYDAYDFRTIGRHADKVILMAHDYNATTMPDNLIGSVFYRNTPVTPFDKVYYAMKAATDENTGVEDTSKLALAISFSSVGWELVNGKLANPVSVRPVPSTIYSRLKSGAQMGYSEVYRNPYIDYKTEEGKNYFVWYEDERSVNDKLQLARLFGIRGVSFWRLGLIPNYSDNGLYYNVMNSLK